MSNTKVLCFDFDGTLGDSFAFVFQSFDYIFYKYLKIHMTQKLFDKLTGPDEKGFLLNMFKDQYKEEYWDEFLAYYKENAHKYIKLFPGNYELLESLKKKGYHLVFLTGRSYETATISLKDLGIYDFFEKIYSGSPSGCIKDKLLIEVAKEYQTTSENVLYIGDSLQDIKDAKAAGSPIISVLFSNPQWWSDVKKNNQNYVLNQKELENKIEEWYQK